MPAWLNHPAPHADTTVMLRPMNPSDYDDDPVVRATISRLRFSVLAVIAGVAACIALGCAVALFAYKDGYERSWNDSHAPAAVTTKAPGSVTASRTGRSATKAAPTKRQTAAQRRATAKRQAARRAARQAAAAQAAQATAGPPAVQGGPGRMTYAFLFSCFLLVGFGMFVMVRRPFASARRHAAELVRAYRSMEASTLETFAALNATVEAKDRYTAGHGLRVTLISILIGQELGLSEHQLDVLRHAATFHDIGKIAVPDDVLQKPGRLTDEEFEAMKVHPVESARICSKIEVLREAVPAIRGHHERLDGRGYPDSLEGTKIPLGARIIAVADTWDAITSDRPYRRGQPAAVALDEIRRVAGTQFDPKIVRAFLEVLAKDPWMFGLTPADVERRPSAPGQQIETPSRASEGDAIPRRGGGVGMNDQEPEIDWAADFETGDGDYDAEAA